MSSKDQEYINSLTLRQKLAAVGKMDQVLAAMQSHLSAIGRDTHIAVLESHYDQIQAELKNHQEKIPDVAKSLGIDEGDFRDWLNNRDEDDKV